MASGVRGELPPAKLAKRLRCASKVTKCVLIDSGCKRKQTYHQMRAHCASLRSHVLNVRKCACYLLIPSGQALAACRIDDELRPVRVPRPKGFPDPQVQSPPGRLKPSCGAPWSAFARARPAVLDELSLNKANGRLDQVCNFSCLWSSASATACHKCQFPFTQTHLNTYM